MIELINFTKLNYDDKIMILEWRNHLSIRKWMFTQEPISLDNHLNYIDSLENRIDRKYFLVRKNKKAVGVIDFTNIDLVKSVAEIGLYSKPNLKGIGSILMNEIINYGFQKLKIITLISEVIDENYSAIKLYKKFEFKEINKRENIIIMELKNENR